MCRRSDCARRAVTGRSLLLGTLASILVAFIVPLNDYKLHNTYFAGNFFPTGPFTMLLAFVLTVNAMLWRLRSRTAFSAAELLVMFGMATFASLIPSCSLGRMLYSGLVAPWYYRPFNPNWEPYLKHFPRWMFPAIDTDSPIVQSFFNGLKEGETIPWGAWLWPLIYWSVFAAALFGGSMLLMNLLFWQWDKAESLPFPIAKVCIELVEHPEPGRGVNATLRSPALWCAALGIFAVHLLTGLNTYFPQVPVVKRSWNLWAALSEFPLSHLPGYLKTGTIYFTAIGLGYLVAQDVLLSIWIFPPLMGIIHMIASAYFSWHAEYHYEPNTVGAYIAAAIIILWRGRRHLRMIARQAVNPSQKNHTGEFISYRASLAGLVFCVIVVALWLVRAGMAWWAALVFILSFYLIFMILARLVCAAGLFYAQPGFNWLDMMRTLSAFQMTIPQFAAAAIPTLSICDLRNVPMPYTANLMKSSDKEMAGGRRTLFLALFAALMIGYVVGSVTHLWMDYTWGANKTLLEWEQSAALRNYLMPYLDQMDKGQAVRPASIIAGGMVYCLLDWLCMKFTWWPLHPLGYLTYTCWPIRWMWPSFCLVWWIKFLMLRYGGAGLYMKLRPIFIGLVIGESISVALWMIVKAFLEFSPVVRPAVFLLPA